MPETASRRQPPPTLPAPQVRAQPAASQPGSGRASRAPRGRAGPRGLGRGGGPRTLQVARALPASLLFSWTPQNPQLPGFHRPQLAPLPRFSAMQLQGSLFPRLRIPTLPDSERRRAGGGGRRRRRRRLGQVSVPAAAGSPSVSSAARHPGAEAGGPGGEVRLSSAMRRRRRLGVTASGHLGLRLGPSPWQPPPHSAPPWLPLLPSRIFEFLFLKRTSRCGFGAGDPGRTHPGSAVLCSPSAAKYWSFFFFFLCIIHCLPSPFRPSHAPHPFPLSVPVPEHYLPQSSFLCRFLDQVQLLPASPCLPPPERGEHRLSKSGCQQQLLPTAPSPNSRRIRDYWKPEL